MYNTLSVLVFYRNFITETINKIHDTFGFTKCRKRNSNFCVVIAVIYVIIVVQHFFLLLYVYFIVCIFTFYVWKILFSVVKKSSNSHSSFIIRFLMWNTLDCTRFDVYTDKINKNGREKMVFIYYIESYYSLFINFEVKHISIILLLQLRKMFNISNEVIR